MSNRRHSPEPWFVHDMLGMGSPVIVSQPLGQIIIALDENDEYDKANTYHIALCVNACAGIPDYLLESAAEQAEAKRACLNYKPKPGDNEPIVVSAPAQTITMDDIIKTMKKMNEQQP